MYASDVTLRRVEHIYMYHMHSKLIKFDYLTATGKLRNESEDSGLHVCSHIQCVEVLSGKKVCSLLTIKDLSKPLHVVQGSVFEHRTFKQIMNNPYFMYMYWPGLR